MTLRKRKSLHLEFEILKNVEKMLTNLSEKKKNTCSSPGSSVHRIPQARIVEYVAIPFSRLSFWSRDQTLVSHTAGRFFTFWATRETPKPTTFQ